jgi:hypothetical protein
MFPRMVTKGSFLHVVSPPKKRLSESDECRYLRHSSFIFAFELIVSELWKSLVWIFCPCKKKKTLSFDYLKMFFWLLTMCILTCVVGQDDEYSDGIGCIVHHPPHNDEFSCPSLCDPTLIQAEIVTVVFVSGFYANFDCVKNKTSLKVCSSFFKCNCLSVQNAF